MNTKNLVYIFIQTNELATIAVADSGRQRQIPVLNGVCHLQASVRRRSPSVELNEQRTAGGQQAGPSVIGRTSTCRDRQRPPRGPRGRNYKARIYFVRDSRSWQPAGRPATVCSS